MPSNTLKPDRTVQIGTASLSDSVKTCRNTGEEMPQDVGEVPSLKIKTVAYAIQRPEHILTGFVIFIFIFFWASHSESNIY